MENLIVAHVDADGILSARIIYLFLEKNAQVYFPEWDDFGIHKKTVEVIRSAKPKNLYVLDLGSDRESFNEVRKLLDESIIESVIWIDHHPPDCDLEEFKDLKEFTIIHSDRTCTAGLSYQYAKLFGNDVDDWIGIWAIIGIYGDASERSELSKKILEELKQKFPWMFGEQVFRNTRYKIPQMYTTYFNTPRRIAFHYGARVAFNACEEIEEFGSIDLLKIDDPLLLAQYPYTSSLKYMVTLYRSIRKDVADSAVVYDYGSFIVCLINSQYDLGGYVASVYVGRYNKPVFCINFGISKYTGLVKITARAPENTNIHVGNVLRECFGGGGHKNAGSAGVDPKYGKEYIISKIIEHIEKSRGDLF